MAVLSDEEKRELLEGAKSAKLREDFRKLSENRINPFIADGKVNMDNLLDFLSESNAFIGHARRPFRKIIDNDMRL